MMYGCIGERLSHSFSKEIHEQITSNLYELRELAPGALAPFIEGREFRGLNVTIPYKERVIALLDELDPLARKIGAVNTIVNRDGRLCGYNTDFDGLCDLIRHAGIDLKEKKVAILGTGGTAKTAQAAAEHLGARKIVLVSRTARDEAIDYAALHREHTDIEILINTTPVGMYPSVNEACVSLDCFPSLSGVIDAVYNPLRTRLILSARERGIVAEGGLYMLVAQAMHAAKLFYEKTSSEISTEQIYERLLRARENIVLIGMPSSGKSTIGKRLAELLQRPFYDTDTLFFEQTGEGAGEYIKAHGEEDFRRVESEIVSNLAKIGSAVIATGGGAVLNQENVKNLLHNGRIYFIDRPLDCLKATPSRPLSCDRETLCRLYTKRLPIYQSAADVTISGDFTPDEFVRRILGDFRK